jgi:hypothetical protein
MEEQRGGESMAVQRRKLKGKSLVGHGEVQRTAAFTLGHEGRSKTGIDRFASRFGDLPRAR